MADRGPKKDSKRYTCRNEACERFGRIQYIQPWGQVRCKFCGSENIEQVESRASEKPAPPPGLPAEAKPQEPATPFVPGTTEEPYIHHEDGESGQRAAIERGDLHKIAVPAPDESAPEEATTSEPLAEPPSGEPGPREVEEGLAAEDKTEEAPTLGVGAVPEPPPAHPVISPKNGDLVACKKCGWAVYWDDRYHSAAKCHAAACGSSNIEIKMPVEGK